MSLKKIIAGILGIAVSIIAPGWSVTLNNDLLELEATIVKKFGDWLATESQKLAPAVGQAGAQKLDSLAAELVAKLAAEGVTITMDVARLIAQRAFLQIPAAVTGDLEAALSAIKALA